MALWPDAATAILALRRLLHDGPKDRLVKSKKVVGPVDGVNKTFFTIEDRLVVPAAGSPLPAPGLVVTVDYAAVPQVEITLDSAVLGQFTLQTAPAGTSAVRAEYFYQYFLDEELVEALELAAGELIEADTYLLIQDGLKLAALTFGGHFAFQKQSVRWVERLSQKFLLEEEPLSAELLSRANLFQTLADRFLNNGMKIRDSFYTRHGRRAAPAFARYNPSIGPIGPTR